MLAVRAPKLDHGTETNPTPKPRYKYLDSEMELLSDPWFNIGVRTLHTDLVLEIYSLSDLRYFLRHLKPESKEISNTRPVWSILRG